MLQKNLYFFFKKKEKYSQFEHISIKSMKKINI